MIKWRYIVTLYFGISVTLCSNGTTFNYVFQDDGEHFSFVSLKDLTFRGEKVLRIINTPGGYAITKPAVSSSTVNTVAAAAPIISNKNGGQSTEPVKDMQSQLQISETDLYLLNAIEKLVYRLDMMEQRLRRTEELLHHTLDGSNIKRQDPCPGNFTRVARNCYHFSERQYNWKSATSVCKNIGGNLIELESNDEYLEIVSHILSEHTLKGHDYWTGGLNPGLLWIWSNSARPVIDEESKHSDNAVIKGVGRCLKLSYTGVNKINYSYSGSECSIRLKFICEHEENVTDRALKRIHKSLKDQNSVV